MRTALLRAAGFALAAVGGASLLIVALLGAILASLPLAALVAGIWIVVAVSDRGRRARARIRAAIRQSFPEGSAEAEAGRDRKVVPFGRRT